MASSAAQVAFNSGWGLHAPQREPDKSKFRSSLSNSLLASLSSDALQELESITSIADYKRGDILFLEQEMLNRVFIVVSGELRLSLQDVRGRRLAFEIARRCSVLGMPEALFDGPCEWSAEILYPSTIGVIGRDSFRRFADRHPEIFRIVSMELARTVHCACATLRIVGLSSCVRKRLALQLLEWGERGRKSGDQTQFCMAMTHAQIAEFIGAVRESVTRGLLNFKRSGLVEIRGCMLKIPSTAALRRFAECC